jgi:hypothetical protein
MISCRNICIVLGLLIAIKADAYADAIQVSGRKSVGKNTQASNQQKQKRTK